MTPYNIYRAAYGVKTAFPEATQGDICAILGVDTTNAALVHKVALGIKKFLGPESGVGQYVMTTTALGRAVA